MARPTYVQARAAILAHLRAIGWHTKPDLKVPQALAPSGHVLRFTAQAVYLERHSMWIDIREHSPESFVVAVEQCVKSRVEG